MVRGKITKIVPGKFFFIDNDYWCSINQYSKQPRIGDIVEYEPKEKSDGKKFANNVRFINSELDEYFSVLEAGYFVNDEKKNLKPDLIIEYPKKLADIFQRDKNKNKSSQIKKFFNICRIIEGKYKINKDFDNVISELLKLIPHLYNAKDKGNISEEFLEFLEKNINIACKSPDHFIRGFLPHFESIIAFYKK